VEDKPWRKPGADITDYFNYGFNEVSWRTYCAKQKMLRENKKVRNKQVRREAMHLNHFIKR
jgi:pre-mRNA 3'-end-processing factor FIP1